MDFAKFLRDVATTTVSHAAQFAAGGVLAVALCALAWGRLPRAAKTRGPGGIVPIALLALCGAALPLGSYGVIPLVVVLGVAGLAAPASAAFLIANRFFTMLVPSSDPSFIWRTGYGRPILAVAAGILAGVLLLFVGKGGGSVLRSPAVRVNDDGPLGPGPSARLAAGLVGSLAWKAAIALVVGAILQVAFQGYALREIVTFLFTSPATSSVASFFTQRNVVGPLFLLGTGCITVMLDFVGLSAMALVLKPKGVLLYIGYCAALAVVLCSSALLS